MLRLSGTNTHTDRLTEAKKLLLVLLYLLKLDEEKVSAGASAQELLLLLVFLVSECWLQWLVQLGYVRVPHTSELQ